MGEDDAVAVFVLVSDPVREAVVVPGGELDRLAEGLGVGERENSCVPLGDPLLDGVCMSLPVCVGVSDALGVKLLEPL